MEEKTFKKIIGDRVLKKRKDLGMTREELAEQANISTVFLAEIERGVKGASSETIYKLCNALGVSADYLLMGKEKPADVSNIISMISMLDEEYVELAEEMLKVFYRAIRLK